MFIVQPAVITNAITDAASKEILLNGFFTSLSLALDN